MTVATIKSIVAIKSKNPSDGNISKYIPPINGPLKLPKLKKIPHNKFPVGNNSFGVKSAMYVIPKENIDPTLIPANKKIAVTNQCDVSTKFPTAKNAQPTTNPVVMTFQRPTLSPKIPNGNCVTIAPTEKAIKIIETYSISKLLRNAYTGNNAFREDSKKP